MKYKLTLAIIFLFGFLLRFYQLGTLPDAFTPDELAQSYTAYSFLQTGRDEWGNDDPFILQSFGDYKSPLQTWLLIPSIKLFDLTPFATRLPNALISFLAIITTTLLASLLFKNKKITLFTAILISFSPWHFPLSRLALEANLTVFFSTLATFVYLKKPKSILNQLVASILLSLNLFSYHSAKFFTPLLFLATYLYQLSPKNLTQFFTSLPKKIFLILPFFLALVINFFQSLKSSLRVGDISIFNPTDSWAGLSFDRYLLVLNGLPDSISRLFNNKLIHVLTNFFDNILSYFSPQFLITHGVGETTYGMLTGHGVLGIIPTLGLIFAVYKIFQKKTQNKHLLIYLLTLTILATVPAALAKGAYPGNRLSSMIPFIIMLSSYGIFHLTRNLGKITLVVFASIFIYSTAGFIVTYFYGAQNLLSDGMLYGRRQAMEYLSNYPQAHTLISRSLSQPQAYYTYFTKTDPQITQKYSPDWQRYRDENKAFLDQLGEYRLGNVVFKSVNMEDFQNYQIIIAKPEEFRDQKPTTIIYFPNSDKPALYIYHNPQNEI